MPKAETATEKAPKTAEEKAAAFSGLASSRLSKAVDAVELLANLSNKANYAYTDEQVAKINKYLLDAVKFVNDSFIAGGVKKAAGITV